MPNFEHRICEKLNSQSLAEVAHECVQNIIQFAQADPIEVDATLSFLIQNGFYQQAIKIIMWQIDHAQIQNIWKFLGCIFAQLNFEPNQIVKIENWLSQQSVGHEFAYFQEQSQFNSNDQWQKTWQQKLNESQNQLRKQFADEAKTARLQLRFDLEENFLEKLIQYFPNDLKVKKELREFRERKAFEILDRYKKKNPQHQIEIIKNQENDRLNFSHLSPELLQDEINEDLIIAALMIEDYETCVELIQYMKSNEKNDWLKLEVLNLAKMGAQLLQLTLDMEKKYVLDRDTYYSFMYYRACAYHLLDKTHEAKLLLQEIVDHHPDFRQASQLLRDWSLR